MDKKTSEARIFEYFLQLCPDFAGGKITEWFQPAEDPPDVVAKTDAGETVAVELGSWLDEAQIQRAKQRERIEEQILEALVELPSNETKSFRLVWLHPHDTVRMDQIDRVQLRAELFALIAEEDQRRYSERYRELGWTSAIPSKYPMLAKALHSIQLFAMRDPLDRIKLHWIQFPARGGAYSPESMMNALKQRLTEKRDQYRNNEKLKAFDQSVLVIHYDTAFAYNTPVETPFFKFADAAVEARKFLAGDAGVFMAVFLLIALEPRGRVFRLHP
jgi:hypothetical protein